MDGDRQEPPLKLGTAIPATTAYGFNIVRSSANAKYQYYVLFHNNKTKLTFIM